MPQQMLSVDQVADRLGLHVRTVRGYVRDGRLKAVRIGKQYRIAREDLAALTGRSAGDPPVDRPRHVDVSTVVQIDGVDRGTADRVTTLLMASAAGHRDGDVPLRIETVYDEERARLKVVLLGGVSTCASLLHLVGALVEAEA